jgi:hypothetical protein
MNLRCHRLATGRREPTLGRDEPHSPKSNRHAVEVAVQTSDFKGICRHLFVTEDEKET